jgi:hypothetical protein
LTAIFRLLDRDCHALDPERRKEKRPMRYANPEERKAVGDRIDPAIALVWFCYVIDPYEIDEHYPQRAYPEDFVGRVEYAADPLERVAVKFRDVPEEKRKALRARLPEDDVHSRSSRDAEAAFLGRVSEDEDACGALCRRLIEHRRARGWA